MPPTLYRDTNYSLIHLNEDIRHGNIALPEIQRPFVWKSWQVRDLFDSMYRGFPIGTLVFWETGAGVGKRQIHGSEEDKVPKLLIVDGQQRLTSLYAVLNGKPVLTDAYREQIIRIAFRPSDEKFEVSNAAVEKSPEYVPDVTVLWRPGYKSRVREFMERLDNSHSVSLTPEEQDALEERIDRVRDLRDFRFQVIELNASVDEEKVAEIFVRINSEGVKLNQDSFILTLMSVHWDKGRVQLEDFCRKATEINTSWPSPQNEFINPSPNQMLRVGIGVAFRRARLSLVYNILRGKDLDTGLVSEERRTSQFELLRAAQEEVLDLENWHEFLKCLTAAGFRSSRMISSEAALLYSYVLWLIGRRDFSLDNYTLRSVIARWFFMAHTTGRYTNSPETQLEADLRRISDLETSDRNAFCQELNKGVRAAFTDDFWAISLPNMLDKSAAKSPALASYWAALNLLDAESLFGSQRVRELFDSNAASQRTVERHHLFPRAHLAGRGITGKRLVNAIANMVFANWPENAVISADDPREYWPVMSERMNPEHLRRQMYWHALPLGWDQLDYADFLEKRRKLIAKVARDGFETLWGNQEPVLVQPDIVDFLSAGESQSVEYKSTARLNLRTREVDKRMGHTVIKSVCGFLNAEGGTLLIGVDDNGEVLGLYEDMRTLSKPGRDSYELYLRQLLDANLSTPTAGLVRIRFEGDGGREICLVSVSPSAKPVFAKPLQGGGQSASEFWVRSGNATKPLLGQDMMDYQKRRWE